MILCQNVRTCNAICSILSPGKAPRRRATSMDTKAYEKKRGRAKKKVEQLRAQLEGGDGTPNSSLGGSATDLHLSDTFQLSPQDFRARTSSNASSIGGRLSPIHSGLETDLHDNEVPPMSPLSWQHQQDSVNSTYKSDNYIPENLTESLAEMFVGESFSALSSELTDSSLGSLQSQLSPNSGVGLSFNEGNGILPAPPPYPTQQQQHQSPNQRSPQQNALMNNSLSPLVGGMATNQQQGLVTMTSSMNSAMMTSSPLNTSGSRGSPFMSPQHQMSGGDMIQNDSSMFQGQQDAATGILQQQDPNLAGGGGISWEKIGSGNSAFQNNMGMRQPMGNIYTQQQQQPRQMMNSLNNSLLRQALTQKLAEQQAAAQQQQQQQQQAYQQQQMMSGGGLVYTPGIDDVLSSDFTDLNCDVDQIISQELSYGGPLDFSEDPTSAMSVQQQGQQGQPNDNRFNAVQS